MAAFSLPLHDQRTSPLFDLPAEIRNCIFNLALTTSRSIEDPAPPNLSLHDTARLILPPLGIALRATCQRASAEVDITTLYKNDFIFTCPATLGVFLDTIPSHELIRRVTLSLSNTCLLPSSSDGTPCSLSAQKWLHFLICHPQHYPGAWCASLPTLSAALPHLSHLRMDLGGICARRPAEMAFLGIKTGYAVALSHLLRGLSHSPSKGTKLHRAGPLHHLSVLEIVGCGAHFWDLGDVMRPTIMGEWPVVDSWLDLVEDTLVPWLETGITTPDPWVGMLQAGNRFSLAAMPASPSQKDLARLGYDRATSWADIKAMTDRRERWDHPIFELFT